MAKESKNEKIITIVLAIIISIAAITIMYVSLPNDSDADTDDQEDDTNGDTPPVEEENILTLIYGEEELEYTLSELEEMEAYSGSGSQIKIGALPDIIIKGPYNFTGVRFSTLFNEIDNLPSNYSITITATDGYPSPPFSKNNVDGFTDIYNDTGNVTGNSGATMVLAYKEDGEYISEEDGPLRVVFVGEDIITASDLWAKMVATIEIAEV